MEPATSTPLFKPGLDSLYDLDVYSADGQIVGRLRGYIDSVPEDEAGFERRTVDLTAPDGRTIGPRHVRIDGHGFASQVEIIVPEDQLHLDLPARRATLNLTAAQIRELPHHDPTHEE